jgi:hypothetical protein
MSATTARSNRAEAVRAVAVRAVSGMPVLPPTADARDALVAFVEHLAVLADAGLREAAEGDGVTAAVLLAVVEADTSALVDGVGSALGVDVDGFGGVADLVGQLVRRLVPAVTELAGVLDDVAVKVVGA